MRDNANFAGWPLEIIVPNRSAFWEFLDERWPIFVRQSGQGAIELKEHAPFLKYPGPEMLPFGHDDVRVYMDNLFEDGLLTPVEADRGETAETTWIRVGLLGNKAENTDLRFEELGKHLIQQCPGKSATPQDWLTYAYRYAQANVLWTQISSTARARFQTQFPESRSHINREFFEWLRIHYGGLYNYPASSPLMVHHIPGFINHQLTNDLSRRIAFLLIDGLAIDQWLVLRDSLKAGGLTGAIEENALFAWIPTVTPISRQAAFSGKIPRYFTDTLLRSDVDEARWRQFWADKGLLPSQIGFASVPGDITDIPAMNDAMTGQTRVLGITLYKVDKIMHGMQLGAVGMSGQVLTWAEQGFPLELLRLLREHGFEIFGNLPQMIEELGGLRFCIFDELIYDVDADSRQKLADAIIEAQATPGLDQLVFMAHDDVFEGRIEQGISLNKSAVAGSQLAAISRRNIIRQGGSGMGPLHSQGIQLGACPWR